MTYLDLSRHSFEEIEGKCITINSCDYEICPLYAEGGEVFVFPITNRRSQLIDFVVKLSRYRKGSEKYEDFKVTRQIQLGFLGDILMLSKVKKEKGFDMLHTELYEYGNGLFQLQKLFVPPEVRNLTQAQIARYLRRQDN